MSDVWGHTGVRPPLPEWPDIEKLRGKLEELGWEDGKKYGLKEHMLLETIIHDKVFDEAFEKINKNALEDLTPAEKLEVLNQVKNLLNNAAEETLLEYLKYGMNVTVKREKRTYILIDYENIENNTLIYAHELKFPGSPENSKPDFTLLVNGIPLAIIEVEPSTEIGSADRGISQIRMYEERSPDLFRYVQIGVVYADKKRFTPTYPNRTRERRIIPAQPWKVKKKTDGKTITEEDIHDLLKPKTLLEIIRWCTFFREREGRKDKIVARYNQFEAAKKTLQRINEYLSGGTKKNGLIWHWQGSGKTYTMFFTANKFFEEHFERNPLIFFIVDRRELQRQLTEFLKGLKAPRFKSYLKTIENIEELKKVITRIKRSEYREGIIARGIYITLIQKFRRKDFEDLLETLATEYLDHLRENEPETYEQIIEKLEKLPPDKKKEELIKLGGINKSEVLLLIDEAHRSQYGLLASVMKNVFPNAMRFAFTGTPVFRFEERNTFLEFAYPPNEYYLDVYFIGDSIDDGFTLPLTYDVVQEGPFLKEGVKILLKDEDIKKYIDQWLEISGAGGGSAADDVETILETEEGVPEVGEPLITRSDIIHHLNKVKVFLTNERRLEKLAEYIASRIEDDTEGFKFKAMVVAANRRACVILKRFLDEKLLEIYGPKYGEEDVRKWTEVVMTYDQNDRGEILSYKEELIRRRGKRDTDEINLDIQTEFKEKDNPKILIVTDMLITGFDAPKLKVMYLDKPLYEHRLLQATARVNRPYDDGIIKKRMGLIVDSVGLLRYLREGLRTYELIAQGDIVQDLEENLLRKVEERFEDFKKTLRDTKETLKFLRIDGQELGIDTDQLKELIETDKMAAQELIADIDRKLRTLALFWDRAEAQKAIQLMNETIQQFRALGSHRGKMLYYPDVQIIAYIYGSLLRYIRGERMPKQFWEGLIEIIHEKTLVEDFKRIVTTVVTNDDLRDMLTKLREIRASKLVPEKAVADAYRMLRALLEELPQNPVYREIYERIERARRDWIDRNIDTVMFLDTLTDSIEYKLEYDKKVEAIPTEDRITETVKTLITQKYETEPPADLPNFRKELSRATVAPRITQTHKRRIRTALLKDLITGLRGKIKTSELVRLAGELVEEYVLKELERAKGDIND